MAFVLPTFNLVVRIRRFTNGPYGPGGPVAGAFDSPAGMRLFKTGLFLLAQGSQGAGCALLLPKGTDVRMNGPSTNADMVEAPKGSGLWWTVRSVFDVAKGYPNEYRLAVIFSFNTVINLWVYPQP